MTFPETWCITSEQDVCFKDNLEINFEQLNSQITEMQQLALYMWRQNNLFLTKDLDKL